MLRVALFVLQHAGWKERLASMESLLASVKGMEDISPATASMLVQGVACLPGWAEKNFQVCCAAPLASYTTQIVPSFCSHAQHCQIFIASFRL